MYKYYTTSERLTKTEKIDMKMNMDINIWHEKITAWMIEKAMLITEKKWMSVCVCIHDKGTYIFHKDLPRKQGFHI